jgi:hypothetical protein
MWPYCAGRIKVLAKSVTCGYFHSMVISSKGQVYTCGRGYKVSFSLRLEENSHPCSLFHAATQGFLGHKNQNNIRSFLLVDALKGLKVVQVCAARNHSLVLSTRLRAPPPSICYTFRSMCSLACAAGDGAVYSFGFPKHGRSIPPRHFNQAAPHHIVRSLQGGWATATMPTEGCPP